LTRYPEEERAADARKRLQAMGKPIPTPTPEAIAQNKKEQESRGSLSTYGKLMMNFKKGPDVSEAATVGEPTLVDPKQASAPEIVRAATASVMSALEAATTGTAKPGTGKAPPPENAAVPRSDAATTDAATGTAAGTGTGASTGSSLEVVKPAAGASGTDNTGIEELGNDLAPPANGATTVAAPPLPPTQVNDAPKPAASGAASTDANAIPAAPADPTAESSSKKKKKHHLFPF
jgi:outer membrane protein assembly factor BamD